MLGKLSCVEPLATETPAAVVMKPELPGLLVELPCVEALGARLLAVTPEALTELPCVEPLGAKLLAAVALEPEILIMLVKFPCVEPLGARLLVVAPEALTELPCVEPLGAKLLAAVALEPEILIMLVKFPCVEPLAATPAPEPKILAEFPNAAPEDNDVVAPVGKTWLGETVVRETRLVCDAAVANTDE